MTTSQASIESMHMRAITLALTLETMIDPKLEQGIPQWVQLAHKVIMPSPTGEDLRNPGEDYELYLGELAHLKPAGTEETLRSMVEECARELNAVSECLELGAIIKMELVVSDNVTCHWSVDLEDADPSAVANYWRSVQFRIEEIFKNPVLEKSEIVHQVMKSLDITILALMTS